MYSGSSDSGGSYGSPSGRSNSQARTYTCKICGNGFNSGQSLGGHMNVHRGGDARKGQCSRSSTPPAATGDYDSTSYDDSSMNYKGVRFRSEQHKWVAEIRPPKSRKTWWLGTYGTAVEAAYAYDVAITYFGSETSLNFDGHPVYRQIPRISPTLPKQDFAVQLRKVVKEYGKLAMQSGIGTQAYHHREEDEASTSWKDEDDDNEFFPYQQQQEEEYVLSREAAEIDWYDIPNSFPVDQTSSFHHDTPFDFEMAAPFTFEPIRSSYSTTTYEPAATSDYASSSGVYNDYQPTTTEYYRTNGFFSEVPPSVIPQVDSEPDSEYEPNKFNWSQMPPVAMPSDYGYNPNGYQPHQQSWSPFQCSNF